MHISMHSHTLYPYVLALLGAHSECGHLNNGLESDSVAVFVVLCASTIYIANKSKAIVRFKPTVAWLSSNAFAFKDSGTKSDGARSDRVRAVPHRGRGCRRTPHDPAAGRRTRRALG